MSGRVATSVEKGLETSHNLPRNVFHLSESLEKNLTLNVYTIRRYGNLNLHCMVQVPQSDNQAWTTEFLSVQGKQLPKLLCWDTFFSPSFMRRPPFIENSLMSPKTQTMQENELLTKRANRCTSGQINTTNTRNNNHLKI